MLSIVLTISVVTVSLRALPFFAMERIARSGYLRYLGQQMPIGVMVLLVAYTIRNESFVEYPYGIPHVSAAALTIFLYLTVRNSLVAIMSGLVLYMLLVNLVV
jgi:branched-subunit amino acid transport protein AzlD